MKTPIDHQSLLDIVQHHVEATEEFQLTFCNVERSEDTTASRRCPSLTHMITLCVSHVWSKILCVRVKGDLLTRGVYTC